MRQAARFIVLAILSFVALFPVYIALVNSFKPLGDILKNVLALPPFPTLKNYIHVIESVNYFQALWNTLVITVFAVSITIVVSAMCAYMLSRSGDRLSGGILILFSTSMLVPFQTFMLPLVKIAAVLHLDDSIPGLIFVMIPLFSSFAILTYHGFVKSIPRELDEAAEMDGASRLRTFFQIIFPTMSTITASLAVLYTLWAWNDFALPLVLLRSSVNKTVTLVTYNYYSAQNMRWDYILAALSMAAIPIIVFYALMQKKIISGISEGAVKG
jgi:raffinose/stachyose/melibiose transport system permease protein